MAPKSTSDWDAKYRSDGTRKGDNAILSQIDRANGAAENRRFARETLEREERSVRDKSDVASKVNARLPGPSGMPRWMEPFSPVDMFGRPTVFAGPGKRR